MIDSQYMRRLDPKPIAELPEPSKSAAEVRRKVEAHQEHMRRLRERKAARAMFS